MPNFAAHAADHYRAAAYDIGNQFTVPYASGITGIAYNPDFVDREITSIADLWDPEFRGRVGMMSDVQEIGNFGMMLNGVNPEESDEDDWEAAAAVLREQRDAGIVRAYYGQDYVQPLTNGDVWLTMAWSGDVYQQNVEEGTNLRFVIPEEGATLWTDNMMIPLTSEAPVDAIELMDFFYEPEIAAGLAAYINYIPPVPESQEILAQWAAESDDDEEAEELSDLVDSPLVFPTEQDYAKLFSFARPDVGDEEQAYIDLFNAITQA
jgi:spermidine/putrescine transport system substrate-binding protein